MNVIQSYAVVKLRFFLIGEVSKAVPYMIKYLSRAEKHRVHTLATTLGVESPDIVVNDARRLLIDMFVENLTTEEWNVVLSIQRPIQRDSINQSGTSSRYITVECSGERTC